MPANFTRVKPIGFPECSETGRQAYSQIGKGKDRHCNKILKCNKTKKQDLE